MNKFHKWLLKRIAKDVVVQGNHVKRVEEFNKILIDAAREQFTEDNKPTVDMFLRTCFELALKDTT